MKSLKIYLFVSVLLMSLTACAGAPRASVRTAFKKMYPQATNVDWDKKGGYYIADFRKDGQELDVWFDKSGRWIMTETDVESLQFVPQPVSAAFMKSTMASMKVEDVRIITFPRQPAVIVIEVDAYNSDKEYQLFYSPDGSLLQTFDVTRTGGEIYPGLFE